MGVITVQRPEELIIEYLGEFYDIAKPGKPYFLIPGITKVRSRVKVNTTQLLRLYREESDPILVKDGIEIRPYVTVTIVIKDPYKVTYDLQVHDNFVLESQALGIIYNEDEYYFYAIEETLDSLVRRYFGSMDVERVIAMDVQQKPGGKFEINNGINEILTDAADAELKEYGVDVKSVLISQVRVLSPDVLKTLQKKFEATQNKKIYELEAAAEAVKVTVEAQKALGQAEIGKGKGAVTGEQMSILIELGLTPKEAAEVIVSQGWAQAAKDGANIRIISAGGGDGKTPMPIMTGIGIGIGQEAAQEKPPEKPKEKLQEKDNDQTIKKDQGQGKKEKKQTK